MALILDGTTGISATGNITGGNVIASGTLYVGSFSPSSISTTGNVTGNYILGNGSQLSGIITSVANINLGTSNVTVVSSGGNVSVGVGGTDNVAVFATSGVYVTGIVSATGNITGDNLSGTNLTGTLATAAQTNITSVGTLSSLSVTGNVTAGNTSATNHTGTTVSVTGAVTGAGITGSSLTVTTGNITAGNLLLSGAIVDSAQLDIQTSAANANIVLTPNGTGNVNTGANLSVTGNVQGGNLRTAGLISATGSITVGGDISLTGNIVDAAAMTISTSSNGNITLSPNGTGVVVVNKDIQNGQGNGVGNIGSATTYFNTVFAKATSAQYADLAENYEADAEYEPGTVVVFGGTNEITISDKNHDTAVA
jgi:hypothetical protein